MTKIHVKRDLIVAVDIGTTATKTLIVDIAGNIAASASSEYPLIHMRPSWAEVDPENWWNAFIKTVRTCFKIIRPIKGQIVGISVTSQREAIVLVDANGRTLGNAIIWTDRRTDEQVKDIKRMTSTDEVLMTTGLQVGYMPSTSKLLWLKKNASATFEKARYFLPPKDYINLKLTGEIATDPSMASRTMLFDINKHQWSESICEALAIPISKLPPLRATSDVIGELSPETRKTIGLREGIPVLVGGADNQNEALCAGAVDEGDVAFGTGTGDTIEVPLNEPRPDFTGRADCGCHVVEGKWVYELIINSTGESTDWFRNSFGYEETLMSKRNSNNPYRYLFNLAAEVEPGADGLFFYPYLSGALVPKFNLDARGVFFGITHAHTKAHFVRSIMEGIAFQYVGAIQILRDLMKKDLEQISVVSGATKSELWNQMKADMINKPIRVPLVEDAPALAGAILFAVARGYYHDLASAVKRMVRRKRTYKPRGEMHLKYRALFEEYDRVYESIKPGFKRPVRDAVN